MGYTNAMQIMHGDVTFILQEEIPHITIPFVDDVLVKGPLTRYERPDGSFETIPENPGIRRFVWEHMNNFNQILQRMKKVGGTFNGKKLVVCAPSAVVVGHRCSYEGRIPDESYVQRIKDWPACRTVTEVRSFLGTCGVLRIFIKDYSKRTRKLVHLTRKDVPFQFGEKEQTAMEDLKDAVVTSPALKPIDYQCGREVILAVDSSVIAVGFILLQLGGDGKRYPSRFGSIAWNDRESRYSQAKVELYGLFRALRSYRIWLVGLETFTVEVDAKYIKGMLSNPDIQPNAAMNRWIAGILMFDFDLVHVPAEKHVAADGLSRRPEAASDGKEEDDFEDWIDQAQGFAMELLNPGALRDTDDTITVSGRTRVLDGIPEYVLANEEQQLPILRTDKAKKRDRELLDIQEFLQNPKRKAGMKDPEFQRFIQKAIGFFLLHDKLWHKQPAGKHQVVIPEHKRFDIIKEAHDGLGHKGSFVVRNRLLERFWWPLLDQDVKWYCQSCHECQTRQIKKILIPPIVAMPASLFQRVHMDVMHMPKAGGFRGIVHARCSLSGYPEARPLRKETATAIAAFIFEEILCRWGALEEIVTDNGSAFIKAVDILGKQYGIHTIQISAYNH